MVVTDPKGRAEREQFWLNKMNFPYQVQLSQNKQALCEVLSTCLSDVLMEYLVLLVNDSIY